MRIKWLGHASFEIEVGNSIIYVDPYVLPPKAPKADLVLITHDHFDHCDIEALKRIEKKQTLLVATDRAAEKLGREAKVVSVGDLFLYEGVLIKVVPAYAPDSGHHPRGHGIGYVIDAEEKRVYVAGDTGLIPEMRLIDEVSVAILPVGGPHTMDVKGAVKAAQILGAEIVIPMHYGHFKDSGADIRELKKLVEGSSHSRVEDLTHAELHI